MTGMSNNEIDLFIQKYKNYFDKDDICGLKSDLRSANIIYEEFNIVIKKLKNPSVIWVISLIGGWCGIDRFYLGEIGLGFLKIFVNEFGGIWWIIDLFRIKKHVRIKNREVLLNFINYQVSDTVINVDSLR